jgi:hypothetical protein
MKILMSNSRESSWRPGIAHAATKDGREDVLHWRLGHRRASGRHRPLPKLFRAMNILCGFIVAAMLFCIPAALAGEPLPIPQQAGGMSLFEALKKRSSASGGDFSLAEVTREELSSILWAASGLNRGEKGWTVPMWRGVPPYCRVYVAADNGVFLYDWKNHSLEKITDENIKGKIGKQTFVKKAYYTLIFVSDAQILSQFDNEDITRDFSHVAVGAMTQNVYLACAALRIGARYIHSMNTEEISRALKLPQGDVPIALMLLGK